MAELYANAVQPGAVKIHGSYSDAMSMTAQAETSSWWKSFFFSSSSTSSRLKIAPDGLPGVSECARNPLKLSEINRHLFSASKDQKIDASLKHNQKVPALTKLASEFSLITSSDRKFNGGSVNIYGRDQRVTHAISSFGMESKGRG